MEWYEKTRWMTFNVAIQAALGDLLTKEDLEYLFPYVYAHGRAVFSSVRSQLPLLASKLVVPIFPGGSIKAAAPFSAGEGGWLDSRAAAFVVVCGFE